MKLKAELGLHNLNRHLPAGSLRILDAGGGSGCDALPLARQGYRIDLVDYSAEMLRALREKEEYISRGESIRPMSPGSKGFFRSRNSTPPYATTPCSSRGMRGA